MQDSWIVLLPPIIVLSFAFLTHRIISAITLGILSATLIATDFSIIKAMTMAITYVWQTSELQNMASWDLFFASNSLMMILFSFILGIFTVLLGNTGGACAYRKFVSKRIETKKDAEKASLVLSFFFFLDDYFSSLTVGSVMYPLTDKFKIARAKLAFLVNSIAAPLCVMFPISTWGAIVLLNLQKSGISNILNCNVAIHADPFFLYLGFIPFIFYSIISITSAWFIVLNKISFGLMYKHEKIAQDTENLFGGKIAVVRKRRDIKVTNSSMIDFLFPLSLLLSSIIIIVLYIGDYRLFGGQNSFVEALKNTQFIKALFIAGCFSLLISTIFYLARKKLNTKTLFHSYIDGLKLIGPSLLVLLLAWSLADLLNNELSAGQFIAKSLVGHLSVQFLPFIFFIVTAIISTTIGSAWGTIAFMIPLAIQMLISLFNLEVPITPGQLPILFPALGAILSGAVTGNHISPTADTMVMAATSSGCYHMDHVRTQHTYSIPAFISTAIAFLFTGFFVLYDTTIGLLLSLGVGIIVNFSILLVLNKLRKIKE